MSRAVMQQALEALEKGETKLRWAAISALKQALAEPEQDELRRLHAENEALREVNESFGKRQEWWNDKMVALEERNAELVEALRWIGDHDLKGCDLVAAGYIAHGFIGRAREALAKVEASNG